MLLCVDWNSLSSCLLEVFNSQLNTCSPTFLWMAGRCQDDELFCWDKKMDPEKLSCATDHPLSDLAFPDGLSSEMLNKLFKANLSKFLSIYGCSHPLLRRSGRIISNIFCIPFNFWFSYMPFLQFLEAECAPLGFSGKYFSEGWNSKAKTACLLAGPDSASDENNAARFFSGQPSSVPSSHLG